MRLAKILVGKYRRFLAACKLDMTHTVKVDSVVLTQAGVVSWDEALGSFGYKMMRVSIYVSFMFTLIFVVIP